MFYLKHLKCIAWIYGIRVNVYKILAIFAPWFYILGAQKAVSLRQRF